MPTDTVPIRIDRALMASSICCPACGLYCRCTGYVEAELALFECRACAVRYFVGLGPCPVLRVEALAPASGAA